MDPKVRWQYCDIPTCKSKTHVLKKVKFIRMSRCNVIYGFVQMFILVSFELD